MQRYFSIDEHLNLSNKDKHHIINVMRMKENDNIQVAYNEKVYLMNIKNITKDDVILEKVEEIRENHELDKKVIIAVPLVTESKLDLIFQKCTELGIYEFIIYESERSKVKSNDKINKKIDRWNLIIKEAAEQSYRNYLPKVTKINKVNDLINIDSDIKLVASTKKIQKNIKKILQNSTNYDRIIIVVGPEGGLTPIEEDFLLDNGYEAVTFGDTILRCETAPIFIMSAIKYELMR